MLQAINVSLSTNNIQTLETPVNRAFQFFKPLKSLHNLDVSIFEKSGRCNQESFSRML